MPYTEPVRAVPALRIRWARIFGLLVAVVAVAAALAGVQPSAPSPSSAAREAPATAAPPREAPLREPGRVESLGEAGGAVPAGTSVFDDGVPAVGNLDPVLLEALRRAAADAADAGVPFVLNGGWRSSEYQRQLRREAVARYGSEEEAARWVAAPDASAHVSGDAVDIGPAGAAAWLSARSATYGLCRIYANEPWHFELRPQAIGGSCPAPLADAAHDPRP